MKALKAYIHGESVPEAVHRLQAAGAPGISIVEIHPVGYGYEPNYFDIQFENPLSTQDAVHCCGREKDNASKRK